MAIDTDSARTAENLLTVRGMRGDIFPSEIFDEHAWNMMLRLFVAEAGNEPVTATDLMALTKTPPAVGERWLAHLVADAQIEPYSEGGLISLTRAAVDRMNMFLHRAAGIHESDGPAETAA
ncbi:hypothetical protein HMP09_1312 [Sphingomonas sp. HMP9]|uniref:hypothetical protein n=1 Tax=Sphingomonas sp. HMP9 TaxID=1517554 RepID=UPI0015971037|nr:hypothetical protein [Sphingomonas sp. HMP9]BCA62078.1 hypothetical protein HMP09_1312 [Sphingomonas sp. HMP9]